MSQRALAAILKKARDEPEGLPECSDAKDIREARNSMVKQMTPYGRIHQTLSLDGLELEVQSPHAMLHHAARTSAAFSDMLRRSAQRAPSSLASKWRVLLYLDEVLPGNNLAYKNTRKLLAFYWTFADFGAAALSDEEAGAAYISHPSMTRHVTMLCIGFVLERVALQRVLRAF